METESTHVSYREGISSLHQSINMLTTNVNLISTVVSQLLVQQLNGDPKSMDELVEEAGKLPAGTAKNQILGMLEIAKLVSAERDAAASAFKAVQDDPAQTLDARGQALLRFFLLDELLKAIRKFIQDKIKSAQ